MPVFSSFISYRNSKKTFKQSFSLRRLGSQSSTSVADIIDINERELRHASPRFNGTGSLPGAEESRYGGGLLTNVSESPAKLNLEFPNAETTDWFGADQGSYMADETDVAGRRVENSPSPVQRPVSIQEEIESINFRANPETTDDSDSDSSFGNEGPSSMSPELEPESGSWENIEASKEVMRRTRLAASVRKQAPSPIKIPALRNSRSSGQRKSSSSRKTRSRPGSRPDSQATLDELSAISGTTLARALIGNTFVLSHDNRASRYRSGMTPLARQDSATLPRGDLMLSSPHWRRSGGEIVLTPDSATFAVPPVPPNAEMLYIAPKTPRRSASETREKQRRSEDITSKPTTPLNGDRRDSLKSRPLPPTRSASLLSPKYLTSRRISRISEASSAPTTPERRGAFVPNSATSSEIPDIPRGARNEDFLPKSPNSTLLEQFMPDSSSSSAPDIGQVLDSYHFITPPDSWDSERPAFSPDPEGQEVIVPSRHKEDNAHSSKRNQVGKVVLNATLSSSAPRARLEISRSQSDNNTTASSTHELNAFRLSRLPIGERPRSLQVPQSPFTPDTRSPPPMARIMTSPAATPPLGGSAPSSSASSGRAGTPASKDGTRSGSDISAPAIRRLREARSRSGSTPSPIKVVRDSQDYNAYKITVTPDVDGSVGSTPTTGESDSNSLQQRFPETPDAFSPMWSPEPGSASPGVPYTPGSAASTQPNLAQKILLTRAATSARPIRRPNGASRAARHPYANVVHMTPEEDVPITLTTPFSNPSRAASPAQLDTGAEVQREDLLPSPKASIHSEPSPNPSRATSSRSVSPSSIRQLPTQPEREDHLSVLDTRSLRRTLSADDRAPSPAPSVEASSALSESMPNLLRRRLPSTPPQTPSPLPEGGLDSPRRIPASPLTSRSLGSPGVSSSPKCTNRATVPSPTPAPPGPPPPPPTPGPPILAPPTVPPSTHSPAVSTVPPHPPRTPSPSAQPVHQAVQLPPTPPPALSHPLPSTSGPSQTILPPPPPPPPLIPPQASSSSAPPQARPTTPAPSQALLPPTTPHALPPTPIPPQALPSTPAPLLIIPPTPHALPSPPQALPAPPNPPMLRRPRANTGLTSITSARSSLGAPPPYNSVVHNRSNSTQNIHENTTASNNASGSHRVEQSGSLGASSRRPRVRPPLPIGPRGPSGQNAFDSRSRNASVSSQNPLAAGNGRRLYSCSPQFRVPSVKWRGFTMEAAKWTFTSSQLQNIVSRAIRQSGEASSIRLLRLEDLDEEIPAELQRLETKQEEIKARFKTMTQRRGTLLKSLSAYVTDTEPEEPTSVKRIVDELADLSMTIDSMAEELHSVDEQIRQITVLNGVHDSSALAMALRKLNASFLKQVSDNQALRLQIETLEAERDEAWKHAHDLANEYDDLNDKTGNYSSSKPLSRRSSRMAAVRKSSIRVSKAGLRSSGFRSQRSSTSSSVGIRMSNSPNPVMFPSEDIPPVPPMPSQRPLGINTTNLATRSSGLSSFGTPTSETRAMVQAQEELYDMLGISVNEAKLFNRRPRSETPNSATDGPMDLAGRYPRTRKASTLSRRSSLPASGDLKKMSRVLSVEQHQAMLAFGLVSD